VSIQGAVTALFREGSHLAFLSWFSTTADQERIRKEVTEQYTVKIQDYELKLNNAEAKIKGNSLSVKLQCSDSVINGH